MGFSDFRWLSLSFATLGNCSTVKDIWTVFKQPVDQHYICDHISVMISVNFGTVIKFMLQ